MLAYDVRVPKLWNDTIEEHRRAVHDAIVETTATLIQEHGVTSVTMSQIAEETGIGRATLYKYFADVEAILVAWHKQHIEAHFEQLEQARDRATEASDRLEAVLEKFALISHEHHGTDLARLLHKGEHAAHAERHLQGLVRDLIAEGSKRGALRDDVSPDELASYCLHALQAASALPSKAAVRRLVRVTLAGLLRSRG